MTDQAVDEARLVELAVAGDFDSFAALYTRFLDAIYRYIYFRTGDQQDAEDLAEQVFMKAWEALPNYKPVGSRFINWLYRISHNMVVDHHRHRRYAGNEVPATDTNLPDQQQTDILDTIISTEEENLLAAAITRLPEEYQMIIVLRFIEGMGHAEVAHILDRSEVACRGLQHRALAALNKLLTAQLERG